MRRRAAEHSRSIEAEVSAILEEAVRPATRVKWGSALVAAFAAGDAGDLDITRDSTPAEGADLA